MAGGGLRTAAERAGVDGKTARRYVEAAQAGVDAKAELEAGRQCRNALRWNITALGEAAAQPSH